MRRGCAKGWSEPIVVDVPIGPDPVPIGHGSLVPDSYGDPASEHAVLQQCNDSCTLFPGILYPSAALQPYVGTGTALLLYGGLTWSNATSYQSHVQSFVVEPCPPLAVEQRTWSDVKLLFR